MGWRGGGRTSVVRVDSLPQVSLDQDGVWSAEHDWAGRREARANAGHLSRTSGPRGRGRFSRCLVTLKPPPPAIPEAL